MTDEYLTYGHVLEPYIADTSRLVLERLDRNEMVVFEGAQGAMLDIDHGTYPFVTSSNPVAGAACIGAGVGPKDIDEVWGVAKAYVTRVGAGPFPTEIDGPLADEMRERGGEYGTTTGRPRRVGWMDLVALRYAARLNSLTALAITKLDVLAGFDAIRACVRYRNDEGAEFAHFPYHQTVLHHAAGEYIEMPGFTEDLSECRSESDLPDAAREYLRFVADFVGRADRAGGRRPGSRAGHLDRRGRRRGGRAGRPRGQRRLARRAASASARADPPRRPGAPPAPGTPMTTARSGTSRTTTAPAAMNASSPITTPGVSTTPPPTRQARRSVAPRSGISGPWRAIVSSLVMHHPGADEDVVLDDRRRR